MGEQFNIDLPARFQFTESEQEKKDKELEEYLNKLTIQLDEMFKRLFNRTSEPISWSIHTLSNDATPSVGGGRLFLTGGTTTVTDFDDGVEGQIITVISAHAITITDGTNIFLNASGNWTMASTDTLTCVCKADGKWYEMSRSDNT
jgi:hypothetical protein